MFDNLKAAWRAIFPSRSVEDRYDHFVYKVNPPRPWPAEPPEPRPKPKSRPTGSGSMLSVPMGADYVRNTGYTAELRGAQNAEGTEATLDIPMPPGVSAPKAQDVSVATNDQTQVLFHPGTPLMCTSCKTSDARTYYLKRQRGLYALLCFREGKGCWESSGKTCCSYVDTQAGVQCTRLAEFEVVSLDGRSSLVTCLPCLPFMINPNAPDFRVCPLD